MTGTRTVWLRRGIAALIALGTVAGCTHRGVGGQTNDNENGNGDPSSWTPPVEDPGEPGWRGSTTPWTPGEVDYVLSFDLWSHPDHGVFVLHGVANDCTQGCTQEESMDFFLSRNDGTGWVTHWTLDEPGLMLQTLPALTGFPDGRLVLSGGQGMMGDLMILEGQTLQSHSVYTYDTFVVNDQLAYASTDREEKLIRYDGQGWGPVPVVMPYTAYRLWADEQVLFAAGDLGTIMSFDGTDWVIHDTGTIEAFTALWGFGPDDVWAGTVEGGLYHWDGLDWSRETWPEADEPGGAFIQGMWGTAGVLYFHTTFQLVRHDASGFTHLGAWPCTEVDHGDGHFTCEGGMRVNAIWGNGPDELFLAVDTPLGDAGDNSNLHLLWYDGAQYHWF